MNIEITQQIKQNINQKINVFEKSYDFDDLVYEALDIEYGDKTIGEILENANTAKNPYYYSYLLALNAPNSKLIKGSIIVDDAEIPYAWVEKDEFVYDVVTKKVVYKDFFYEKLNPKVLEIFNKEIFKKTIYQFSVGLDTVKENPEMVEQFLAFKNFEKLKLHKILSVIKKVDNEEVKKEVLNFYNIVLNSGYTI